jgi:hypothetical protein
MELIWKIQMPLADLLTSERVAEHPARALE